ncbi:vascular endothelial growth factor A-A isoform X3 [Pseudoliparis swirei]|uniref:vascular endothelial growth factor A-A isoform X3 n=1 Tax=Pseudoliparis swirei TaxID=2059687 RepID=UPI0024BEC17E|nr:vascular endothelial growth factor A-A isoform X3 [Pseudoliparis swirei]
MNFVVSFVHILLAAVLQLCTVKTASINKGVEKSTNEALPKLPSALETSQLLTQHVFRLHGIPADIVSDRGPQFISQPPWGTNLPCCLRRRVNWQFRPSSNTFDGAVRFGGTPALNSSGRLPEINGQPTFTDMPLPLTPLDNQFGCLPETSPSSPSLKSCLLGFLAPSSLSESLTPLLSA